MSKKIAIIGANGFLAKSIGRYFSNADWEIYAFGRSEPMGYDTMHFLYIDLLNEIPKAEDLAEMDLVIYTAGAGIQRNLNECSDTIYKMNVMVPVSIANSLRECGFRGTYITFGSFSEMGLTLKTSPFTEDDILTACAPCNNDYNISKRMLTRFVDAYHHDFTHWHFILPTIYGENENPQRLIPYTVNALLAGLKPQFTSGDQIRQYLYIDEVPAVIAKALLVALPSGVYNIGGLETMSVRDVVRLVHESLGRDLADDCFGKVSNNDTGMKFLALDGSKLYGLIDFKPSMALSDNIKKYIHTQSI